MQTNSCMILFVVQSTYGFVLSKALPEPWARGHLPVAKATRIVAVAKKADHTAYTTNGIATEPNRRKYHVWNRLGHVTTLPMVILGSESSVVRFFDTSYSKSI